MKILYVTTVSSTMNAFFKAHIEMLVKEGHIVDLACNDTGWPIDEFYNGLGCQYHHVDFSRSPLSSDNVKAYGQLKKVIENGTYDIVHCHTPNASVITRLVCRSFRKKNGLKVFYTAHGFHFYKGAPKLNWMVYYPVEKFCSRFTDKLITINKEDYELAKNKFRAKEVHYVPGVGVNLSKFEDICVDRNIKRRDLGIPGDSFLITSVGELIPRKNHQIIIKALTKIENENIHYAIVGQGDLLSELQAIVQAYGVTDRVHFLGYRKDVAEIYKVSDIFCLPSIQEGLPVALMEAMASGLPCITSRIRGSVDLINENSGFLVETYDVDGFVRALLELFGNSELRLKMGTENKRLVCQYSVAEVLKKMKFIYKQRD